MALELLRLHARHPFEERLGERAVPEERELQEDPDLRIRQAMRMRAPAPVALDGLLGRDDQRRGMAQLDQLTAVKGHEEATGVAIDDGAWRKLNRHAAVVDLEEGLTFPLEAAGVDDERLFCRDRYLLNAVVGADRQGEWCDR